MSNYVINDLFILSSAYGLIMPSADERTITGLPKDTKPGKAVAKKNRLVSPLIVYLTRKKRATVILRK